MCRHKDCWTGNEDLWGRCAYCLKELPQENKSIYKTFGYHLDCFLDSLQEYEAENE